MNLLLVLTLLASLLGCYTQVIDITDKNFDQVVKKNDQWVLEFYADWCGYCRQFGPMFETSEQAVRAASYEPVYFGKVNIDENPALAARFFVSRLPTLFHIDHHQVRTLPIPRSVAAVVDMVKQEEWQSIDPIGGWRSPFGLFGRLLGWTGYLVKTLSTVSPWLVIGLLSGLLVCSLGLTAWFARRDPKKEEEASVSPATAAGRSTAVNSKNKKSPTAQKRQSKRID